MNIKALIFFFHFHPNISIPWVIYTDGHNWRLVGNICKRSTRHSSFYPPVFQYVKFPCCHHHHCQVNFKSPFVDLNLNTKTLAIKPLQDFNSLIVMKF